MSEVHPHATSPVLPSDRFELRRLGDPRVAGSAVYLRRGPLDELLFAAAYSPDALQAAVLTGTVGAGDPASFVEVAGYIDLETWSSDAALVAGWLDEQPLTMRRVERLGAGIVRVGHVILRPGSGSRLTPADERLHRTFINLPWQITVAIDPIEHTVGVWGVDPEGHLINVGFNLVTPRSGEAIASTEDGPNASAVVSEDDATEASTPTLDVEQ
jgi:hypothetical protein